MRRDKNNLSMKYIFYVIVFVMCIVLPTDCHSSDAYYELINTKDGFEVRYRSFKWELTITGSPYTIKFEGYPQTHIYGHHQEARVSDLWRP